MKATTRYVPTPINRIAIGVPIRAARPRMRRLSLTLLRSVTTRTVSSPATAASTRCSAWVVVPSRLKRRPWRASVIWLGVRIGVVRSVPGDVAMT